MSNIIAELEREQMSREVPEFGPGDTLIVKVRVKEGSRERLQAFEGVCIARRNRRSEPPHSPCGRSPTAKASSACSKPIALRLTKSLSNAVAMYVAPSSTTSGVVLVMPRASRKNSVKIAPISSTKMVRADIHADDERTIESFVDGIWMERGLARNTLAAYKRDLEHLARFLSGRNETLTGVSRASLMEYLAQHEGEASSVARRLSTIRRFFQREVREGRLNDDPSALIQSPRLGRGLPKVLSERHVEALLNAPDTETRLGLRDRAMLETLYATGLRATELVTSALSAVSLVQAWCESSARATRSVSSRSERRR